MSNSLCTRHSVTPFLPLCNKLSGSSHTSQRPTTTSNTIISHANVPTKYLNSPALAAPPLENHAKSLNISSYHYPHRAGYTMDAKAKYKQQQKKMSRNRSTRLSFSANLPDDVCGVWADNAMCAVFYTEEPFDDLKQSILEMVREVGVCNWEDMEELIYCYIALNSSEVHKLIQDAFLSLFS